ncbi:MAG TPA: glycine cleavage system aminomethyltransferase GcvT [Gammaproteobacteria bacterium]|jgi:aminomethyltransferase|nr:glycine cleavage system aminomethyltransferase GcvT [Gammaproteobacteria bacterium]
MADKTPLFDAHVAAGGKMVDFAGWMMPVNYGSQIDEHTAVRTGAGMFDVSHMTIVDIDGPDAEAFLRKVIANDVAVLAEYQALYGAALNAHGGVLDDLIVYRLPKGYRCVVNASTREKMLDWFEAQALTNMRIEHKPQVMLAVQGPEAIAKLIAATDLTQLNIKPFFAAAHGDWLIGRTGYTGEDGVEVMLPVEQGLALWQALLDAGVQPAGLGARDTLRLEAGLNLYGQDMDETTSPLISNIGWTVAWEPAERGFIGRYALQGERTAPAHKLTGIILEDKGVLRHDQPVQTDAGPGLVTSGTYSPTLQRSIGLVRVPSGANGECSVDIRGTMKKARLVKPPFVRKGKILVN